MDHATKFAFLAFTLLSPSIAFGATGLEIYGRVYDTDNRQNGIGDADLVVNVSGRLPNRFSYDEATGKFKAIAFHRGTEKSVTITATHRRYVQMEPINYKTHLTKEKRNVRMKDKGAKAEMIYVEARKLSTNRPSTAQVLVAFDLMQEAIILAPKSRYVLFQADNIRRYIASRSPDHVAKLPFEMINFARSASQEDFFSVLTSKQKYDLFLKLGHGFAQPRDLSAIADDHRPYLDLAVEAYDAAIAIQPKVATAYQGKYLAQSKVLAYFDAIDTITKFFDRHEPVRSELTIKGFLVDWIDYLKLATGYDRDPSTVRNTRKYLEAWEEVQTRLDQYERYFRSTKIRGNKNLQDARKLARAIVQGQ